YTVTATPSTILTNSTSHHRPRSFIGTTAAAGHRVGHVGPLYHEQLRANPHRTSRWRRTKCPARVLRAVSDQVLGIRDQNRGGLRRDSLAGLAHHLIDKRRIVVTGGVALAPASRCKRLVQLVQKSRVNSRVGDGAAG